VVCGERLEHEHAAARQQRAGELEARVLRGRADQGDDPVLDPREEGVLLGSVEAVDLVTEEDRAPPFVLEPLFRRLDDLADPRHAFGDGGKRLEVAVGVVGDDARQRGLAGPRRAPEDARGHVAAADQLAERLAGAEQLLLAEELVQVPRTHAGRERLGRAGEEGRLRHDPATSS